MPWESNVNITPLPEPGKTDHLSELVTDAERTGAKVINEGGGTVNKTFFYPAVLYPVRPEMKIYSEEQFGPVIPVLSFDNIETPTRTAFRRSSV